MRLEGFRVTCASESLSEARDIRRDAPKVSTGSRNARDGDPSTDAVVTAAVAFPIFAAHESKIH